MFSASKSGQYPGYLISRSVRLRSSASAYFSRTPSSNGNRQTSTLSFWLKRGAIGTSQLVFDCGEVVTPVVTRVSFQSGDTLRIENLNSSRNIDLVTSQVFRDPSAWYHFVVVFDTTQATSSNRVKLYVNGAQVTAFSTNSITIAQNGTLAFNSTSYPFNIGRNVNNAEYTDGYLTEVNFIDGQALTPSSFGAYNAYGVWSPMKYNGTYGTNGFYLNFSDNSNNTAATIGKDYSGNGNNWTPNNISVTSGATYDSMLDVPTPWPDGGNGRGNYAVLNPLLGTGSTYNPQTPSGGNLNIGGGSSKVYSAATITMTSEKWYAEFSITLAASGYPIIGVWSSVPTGTDAYPGHINSTGVSYEANGSRDVNGTNTPSWAATFTTNDIIGVACDANTGKVWFSKNGTWLASGDPANGTTPAATLTSGTYIFGPCASASSGATLSANFGQRPFAYTPPSGFKALNTLNLPTPTILKGNQYFDVVLYTGNAVQDRAVTGFGFDLDLAWIKSRNNAGSHVLVNREVGGDKQLFSNLTNAEQTNSDVTNGFTTGGILVGDNLTGTGSTNQNTYTYALWGWKEGATQGFDIVTYTGNGANRTIAHNLGVAPRMMIVKNRSSATNWKVWQSALAGTEYLEINNTTAKQTAATVWNSTTPTSSVFSVGTSGDVNANGSNFVAYLFAEVAGFSRFGSYTGNGSADGPFVFCGFRPRFVMVKNITNAADWYMTDTARDAYNVTVNKLTANTSTAESSNSGLGQFDVLSNGFKQRQGAGTGLNNSGNTYIFAAFAEVPFRYALAR